MYSFCPGSCCGRCLMHFSWGFSSVLRCFRWPQNTSLSRGKPMENVLQRAHYVWSARDFDCWCPVVMSVKLSVLVADTLSAKVVNASPPRVACCIVCCQVYEPLPADTNETLCHAWEREMSLNFFRLKMFQDRARVPDPKRGTSCHSVSKTTAKGAVHIKFSVWDTSGCGQGDSGVWAPDVSGMSWREHPL